MGKHELRRRKYGARYSETSTTTDLIVLAERILADLLKEDECLPSGVECSMYVLGGVLLQVQVGGLADDFTFIDRTTGLYSRQGQDLIAYLASCMDSYNWTNPDDLADRRFFTSVYLLAESEHRSAHWLPGVVAVF
jgi:hypothetical protein